MAASAQSESAFVSETLKQMGFATLDAIPLKIEALTSSIDRLAATIERLAASTAEIREYLDADPSDQDLTDAISENEVILERKRETERRVRTAIAFLRREQASAEAAAQGALAAQAEEERAAVGDASGERGDAAWPAVPPSFDREAPEPSPYQRELDAANARVAGAAEAAPGVGPGGRGSGGTSSPAAGAAGDEGTGDGSAEALAEDTDARPVGARSADGGVFL